MTPPIPPPGSNLIKKETAREIIWEGNTPLARFQFILEQFKSIQADHEAEIDKQRMQNAVDRLKKEHKKEEAKFWRQKIHDLEKDPEVLKFYKKNKLTYETALPIILHDLGKTLGMLLSTVEGSQIAINSLLTLDPKINYPLEKTLFFLEPRQQNFLIKELLQKEIQERNETFLRFESLGQSFFRAKHQPLLFILEPLIQEIRKNITHIPPEKRKQEVILLLTKLKNAIPTLGEHFKSLRDLYDTIRFLCKENGIENSSQILEDFICLRLINPLILRDLTKDSPELPIAREFNQYLEQRKDPEIDRLLKEIVESFR